MKGALWGEPLDWMQSFIHGFGTYTPPEPPEVNPDGVFWTGDVQAKWDDNSDVEWEPV